VRQTGTRGSEIAVETKGTAVLFSLPQVSSLDLDNKQDGALFNKIKTLRLWQYGLK